MEVTEEAQADGQSQYHQAGARAAAEDMAEVIRDGPVSAYFAKNYFLTISMSTKNLCHARP